MSSFRRDKVQNCCRCVGWFVLAIGLLLTGAAGQEARAQSANEYQVKAAFILNFARFIEWPSDAFYDGDTLAIGVIGDDPFGNSIDQIVSRGVANGHRLVVRRMKWGDNLRSCQILFVSSSERKRLGQILDSLRGSSVLTISDLSEFNRSGGMIKFFIQDNKVLFEINSTATTRARLKVSSKLLALSKGDR
jgi:hypothetical protein